MSHETTSADRVSASQVAGSVDRGRLSHFARWILGIAACLLISTTVIFVDETEFVIVARFGRIVSVYDRAEQRGLQFKLPWPLDTVRRFDRRLQLLSPQGREAFTHDRKNVTVEAYVLWKVADGDAGDVSSPPVLRFFRSLGSVDVAEARLTSRLQSILTEQIGRSELTELLGAADSEAAPSDAPGSLEQISAEIRRELIQRTDEKDSLKDRQGIEIVDVRIRRLNLPAGNMRAVFERMRSERQKIAERYRSAGLAENRMIRSQADRQAGELLARANAEAERIRGDGDADAIRILNEAHSRDPEFASTLQTLDAYKQILNERTTLVLSASNSLLKLLVEGIPVHPAERSPDQPSSELKPSALDPANGPKSGAEAAQ
ncbi:MAG: protease modulator HflC [Planctomycetes bacterium]|nr:protease modulator HflC [Planctomycetota bacterium]